MCPTDTSDQNPALLFQFYIGGHSLTLRRTQPWALPGLPKLGSLAGRGEAVHFVVHVVPLALESRMDRGVLDGPRIVGGPPYTNFEVVD